MPMMPKIKTFLPRVEAITTGPKHHFFGYYDNCPWDVTGRFLLALEVNPIDSLPGPDDSAAIGVIDLLEKNKGFQTLAQTRAWNWQQGAMAQWLPSAPDRLIIYNDREGERFISVILDVVSGALRKLPLPIYAVSPDGRFALSINFARLRHTRANYGYAGVRDPWQDELYPKDDGIYWMDLATGQFRLILSYAQIAAFRYRSLMETGRHTVEHLTVNPDGTRFCFLHRFPLRDGGIYTRLLTADPDGSNLHLLAEGCISHLCWYNPSQILAWTRTTTLFTKLRQFAIFTGPLYKWALNWVRQQRHFTHHRVLRDCYCLFTDYTRNREPIGIGVLTEDGHCTFSPNKQWILTDTYPDADYYRTLILYHFGTGRRIDIGRFYSPENFAGEINCDLHPRWNRDGTQVCIDSTHEGQRQVYVVDVRQILRE